MTIVSSWLLSHRVAVMQASGIMLLDSSHQRDESEDDNWQRIARQITLTPEKLAQLTTLRSMMSDKYSVFTLWPLLYFPDISVHMSLMQA